MDKADISTLIAYNFWANARVLISCKRISSDEFIRDVVPNPGWGNLRGILVHTLDTEYGWRSVLQSQDSSVILEATDFADVDALKAYWETEQAAWFDYIAGLSRESLNTSYGDKPERGLKVWQTIVHVVNHGTQHRSEAATILTGYGQSPGELDFDLFLKESPERGQF